MRSIAFLSGGYLPQHVRGTQYDGLLHVVDWRPTWAALAGVEPDQRGPWPLDGHNVLPAILANSTSPRTEVPHNIILAPYNNHTCNAAGVHSSHPLCGAALRVGQYKAVLGYAGWPDLVFPLPINGTGNKHEDPVDPEGWFLI